MSWLEDKSLNNLAKVKKQFNTEAGIRYTAPVPIFSVSWKNQFSQQSPGLNGCSVNGKSTTFYVKLSQFQEKFYFWLNAKLSWHINN